MPRPRPRVPLELQRHIILSIDPLTSSTYTQRYATLRSFSLVCRDWRAAAQADLFSDVVVQSRSAFLRLLRSLKPGGQLAAKVIAMRVENQRKRSSAFKFRLEDCCTPLTSLCITSSTIEDLTSPLHFPLLTHLLLEQTTLSYRTLTHFTCSALPALTSLAWEAIQCADEWYNADAKQLAPETLPASSPSPSGPTPSHTRARTRSSSSPATNSTSRLRTSLARCGSYARSAPSGQTSSTLVRVLTRYADVVKGWEELRVPERLPGGRDWEELRRRCGKLEIRLGSEKEDWNGVDEDYPMKWGFWRWVDGVERRGPGTA